MKKWLMLILSSVLAMGLLVGCGAGEEADTEQDVIQPNVETPAVNDVPASTDNTDADMGEEDEEPVDAELEESTDADGEDSADQEEETPQP